MRRWAERVLFVVAISMLVYYGFVWVDGWMFQNRERRHLEQLLHERQVDGRGAPQKESRSSPKNSPLGIMDDLIGRIEIPRLGISVMVVEGTSNTTLRRAVGHIAGTSLPGNPGNVGISGHRDTFFRSLRNIRRNDIITLTTTLGEYRYRVVSTKIVQPYDIGVLDSSGNQVLTLVTCYPFYFIGFAPKRFIVRAERVGKAS